MCYICETTLSYSVSMGISSASWNGTGASPSEATHGPSVSAGGGFSQNVHFTVTHIDGLYMPLDCPYRGLEWAGKVTSRSLLAFFSCTGGRQSRRDGSVQPRRCQIWRRPVPSGRANVAAGPHAHTSSQLPIEVRREVVAGRSGEAVGEGWCR
jgi:hypothetical protein